MRYAVQRYKTELEEKAYRIYVTDTLKTIAENTAKVNGGSFPSKRYADVIERKKEINAEAIVNEIITSAELVVI